MMRISSGDIAKFKAALKNYQHAQKKELIRIETMKREEQARIERERQEKQRQDEERDRQMQESLSSLGALVLIAGIIAGIYFYWEFIWDSLMSIIAIGIMGFIVFMILGVIFSPAVFPWVFLGFLLFLLTKGCGG